MQSKGDELEVEDQARGAFLALESALPDVADQDERRKGPEVPLGTAERHRREEKTPTLSSEHRACARPGRKKRV